MKSNTTLESSDKALLISALNMGLIKKLSGYVFYFVDIHLRYIYVWQSDVMRMSDVDSLSQGVVFSMSHGKNVFNNPSIDSLPEMYFNFEQLKPKP